MFPHFFTVIFWRKTWCWGEVDRQSWQCENEVAISSPFVSPVAFKRTCNSLLRWTHDLNDNQVMIFPWRASNDLKKLKTFNSLGRLWKFNKINIDFPHKNVWRGESSAIKTFFPLRNQFFFLKISFRKIHQMFVIHQEK